MTTEYENNHSAACDEIAAILDHLRCVYVGIPQDEHWLDTERDRICHRNSAASVTDALGKLVNQLPKGSTICLK